MEFKTTTDVVLAWKESGLTLREFAEMHEMNYATISNYPTFYNKGIEKKIHKKASSDTSLDRLLKKQKQIEQQIKQLTDVERKNAINSVIDLVSKYKIKASEVYADKPVIVVPIRYKDEFGNTWTGRGAKPKWLRGKDPAAYLVNEYA